MKEIYILVIKRLLRQKIMIVVLTIFPLIALFVPPTDDLFAVMLAYGFFGVTMLFSAILITKQMIDDRAYKTIIRIAASPVSHFSYLTGHLLGYFMIICTQVLIFSMLSYVRYDLSLYFTSLGLLMLLVFGIFTLSFALFWHTLFKRFSTSISIFSVFANVIALLGGLSIPLSRLPQVIKDYAVILPTYWFAYGMEQIGFNETKNVLLSACIIFGFAVVFITLGSKRRFE